MAQTDSFNKILSRELKPRVRVNSSNYYEYLLSGCNSLTSRLALMSTRDGMEFVEIYKSPSVR